MTIIVALLTMSIGMASAQNEGLSYNFGDNGCGHCGWFVVVDGVMGGLSTGVLEVGADSVTLSGSISLENNGGFSSVRTAYELFDLSIFKTINVVYRSQGQSFTMSLNNYRRFWKPQFKAVLPETGGKWTEREIPLTSFKKMRFYELVGGSPTDKELAQIVRLGLISNDKAEGKFYLELKSIEFE